MSKREIRAVESFFNSRGMWLVSRLCLVATFVWRKLWDILCCKRRHRASKSLAMQPTYDPPPPTVSNTTTNT
ncbi:unnamed protein product [Lota lota]